MRKAFNTSWSPVLASKNSGPACCRWPCSRHRQLYNFGIVAQSNADSPAVVVQGSAASNMKQEPARYHGQGAAYGRPATLGPDGTLEPMAFRSLPFISLIISVSFDKHAFRTVRRRDNSNISNKFDSVNNRNFQQQSSWTVVLEGRSWYMVGAGVT